MSAALDTTDEQRRERSQSGFKISCSTGARSAPCPKTQLEVEEVERKIGCHYNGALLRRQTLSTPTSQPNGNPNLSWVICLVGNWRGGWPGHAMEKRVHAFYANCCCVVAGRSYRALHVWQAASKGPSSFQVRKEGESMVL